MEEVVGAKRRLLLLEEQSATGSKWLADLEEQFEVIRVVTVIGTRRTLQDGPLVAAILHIAAPETRAVTLIRMLRNQPGMELLPLFVLAASPTEPTAQALAGLSNVEVVELARAHLTLRSRIVGASGGPRREERKSVPHPRGSAPTTASKSEEPKSEERKAAGFGRPTTGTTATPTKIEDAQTRLQRRFATHSAERSQRALAACDELRNPATAPTRRRTLLVELKDLLNVMKGEATLLRLRALAEVLSTAENVVSRLDEVSRSVVVPRGVLGLLGELAGLAASGASIDTVDVELHRIRLSSTEP